MHFMNMEAKQKRNKSISFKQTKPNQNLDYSFFIFHAGVNLREPNSGHTGTGNICPAGTECPVNSGFYSFCEPGTYAPADGVESCYACPQGNTRYMIVYLAYPQYNRRFFGDNTVTASGIWLVGGHPEVKISFVIKRLQINI